LTLVDAVSLLKKPSAMEVKLLLFTRVTWSEVRPVSGGLADEPVGADLEVLELGEVADLRRQLPVRPLSSTWTAVTRLSESQLTPSHGLSMSCGSRGRRRKLTRKVEKWSIT
jgi:hypothetical protein